MVDETVTADINCFPYNTSLKPNSCKNSNVKLLGLNTHPKRQGLKLESLEVGTWTKRTGD